MKKLIFLGILSLSILSFAQDAIPTDVDREITKSANGMDGGDRRRFIDWQKQGYMRMMKIGEESGIPQEEFARIVTKLHRMYGANYVKQAQVVDDEIEDYKEIVKRVTVATSGVVDEATNQKAKMEMDALMNNDVVPKEIMDIYKKSAQELFPENYVRQQEYLKISIRDYNKIVEIIKNR